MVYAIADLTSGFVRMVQAGHPYPILIRQSGETVFGGQGGVPIGLLPNVPFEQIEFLMQPGDRLLLYSDGLTEAHTKDGGMLEEQGLLDIVNDVKSATGPQFLDNLFEQLKRRMYDAENMEDDVSATLFEYNGPEG